MRSRFGSRASGVGSRESRRRHPPSSPDARHPTPDTRLSAAARAVAKAPVIAYRWTLKPWLGWECRHLPTCSEYALDAIELNGAWRGGWLTLSRICRCHPWGTHGFDPAPDIRHERHRLAPWRYGRWRLGQPPTQHLTGTKPARTPRRA